MCSRIKHTKTYEQVVKECTHAVNCCRVHYGLPQLNKEGQQAVFEALLGVIHDRNPGWEYAEQLATRPGAKYPDFRDRIINPDDWPVAEEEI